MRKPSSGITREAISLVPPDADHEDLAAHLRRSGIKADARTVDPGSRPVGAAILEETASEGADVLFKGAYTHARLRQMIFGGPTRHILTHATLPVFMAH